MFKKKRLLVVKRAIAASSTVPFLASGNLALANQINIPVHPAVEGFSSSTPQTGHGSHWTAFPGASNNSALGSHSGNTSSSNAGAFKPGNSVNHRPPIFKDSSGQFMATPPTSVTNARPFLSAQGLDLDLSSANANIVLGSSMFGSKGGATINVGGTPTSFVAGQSVTPGEYVAIQQVLSHQSQSIVLNSQGEAVGGSFSFNKYDGAAVSELTIPANVTALDRLSGTNQALSATTVINYGDIYGYSTNARLVDGLISGQSLTNEAGAIISTSLLAPLSQSLGHTDPALGLTLSSAGGISNAGQITSSGDLNLLAGNGNLTNSGLVQSQNGSININTPGKATDINISAPGGTFSATNGHITVRDQNYTGTANISMNGGDYLSNNLNLYAGNGNLVGTVGNVTGNLNSTGNAGHFLADASVLKLGNIDDKGDPTYASTSNIQLTGTVQAGESIAILADGNITTSGDVSINTQGTGGNVTLIAGAGLTFNNNAFPTSSVPGTEISNGGGSPNASVTVSFTNNVSGGNIDLSTGNTHTGSPIIDTSTSAATVNGGNVTLAAYQVAGTGGSITVPSISPASINTSSTSANGGNVLILAGATSSTSVQIGGDIQTGGAAGMTGGSVSIYTAQPDSNTSTHQVTFDIHGDITGTIVPSGGLLGPNLQTGASVQLANVITAGQGGAPANAGPPGSANDGANAGPIIIQAGNVVNATNLYAYGAGGGGGAGGSLFTTGIGMAGGSGGAGAAVTVYSGGSTNVASVNTSGGGGGAGGGAGNGGVPGTGGTGGAAGSVNLSTGLGSNLILPSGGSVLAAGGASGGSGGAWNGAGGGGGGGGGGSFGGGGGAGGGAYDSAGGTISGSGGTGGGFTFAGGSTNGGGGGSGTGSTFGTGGSGALSLATTGFQASTGGVNNGGLGGSGGGTSTSGTSGNNIQPGSSFGDNSITLTAESFGLNNAFVYGSTVTIQNPAGDILSNFVTVGTTNITATIALNVLGTGLTGGTISMPGGTITTPQAVLFEAQGSIIASGLQNVLSGTPGTLGLTVGALGLNSVSVIANTSTSLNTTQIGSTIYTNQASAYTLTTQAPSSLDTTQGTITVNGNVTALVSIDLQAEGANSPSILSTAGSQLIAPSVFLTITPTASGSIGTAGSPLLTTASALTVSNPSTGGVSITNTGPVQVREILTNGNIQFATTPDAYGNGQIFLAGTVSANTATVTLQSSESNNGVGGIAVIGPLVVTGSSTTLLDGVGGSGTGNIGDPGAPIPLSEAGSVNLTVGTGGNCAVSYPFTAATLNLLSSMANNLVISAPVISVNASTTVNGALTLNTNSLTVGSSTTLQAASVIISDSSATDLTIANAGTITTNNNGNIAVTATPSGSTGGNVLISGGGSFNAGSNGSINITSLDNGSGSSIVFSGTGQTFTGFAIFNAVGPDQSVANNSSQTIQINSGLGVNSSVLSGSFSQPPQYFGVPGLSGTIADNSGIVLDLSSLGTLHFVGSNLAIIASGGITDSGNPVTIDLSYPGGGGNPLGNGGNLILLAGYTFLPAGSIGGLPPNSTLYNNFSSTGTVANITLSQTTINTSGFMNGGNVLIAATGAVALGTTTTAGELLQSGNVTVIAANGITANHEITAGGTEGAQYGGTVTLTVASPVLSNLSIQNGSIVGGSITAGSTTAGNIDINGLTAGSASLTALGGVINSGGSPAITAPVISLSAGGAIFTSTASNYLTVNSTGGGVNITNSAGSTSTINITASNGAVLMNTTSSTSAATVNISTTTGALFVSNQGNLTILGAQAGADVTVINQPDPIVGNGQILIAGQISGSNISLQSSEGGLATGGIHSYGPFGSLSFTSSLTLADLNGGNPGTGDIGTATSPILAVGTGTVAITSGGNNVYLFNDGATTINQSSTIGVFSVVSQLGITFNSTVTTNAASGVINLNSLTGSITGSENLTAGTVNLTGHGIGANNNQPLLITVVNLNLQADEGSAFLNNTGPLTINSASVGNDHTFELNCDASAIADGAVTIAGNVSAPQGDILIFTHTNFGFLPAIIEAEGSPGTLIATNITLQDFSLKPGASIGEPGTPLLTDCSTLSAQTTGNVYISNTGSVLIAGGQAGNNLTFSVATTPDIHGNGQVNLASSIAASPSGLLSQITLNSSESGNGEGGIGPSSSTLTAQEVNLFDGGGNGTGNIGSSDLFFPINTVTSFVQIATGGNASVLNLGSVTLLTSSAGAAGTLQLATTPDGGGNGKITISAPGNDTAGTIILNSSGSTPATSGIVSQSGTLVAGSITLEDGNGTGVGNIGSVNNPVVIQTGTLAVATTGNAFMSNDGNNGSGPSANLSITSALQAATVSVATTNSGSLTVVSNPVAENINLNTSSGPGNITLTTGLAALANPVTGNGGSVTLSANNIVNTSGGPLALTANGSATGTGTVTGSGGSVSVTTNGTGTNLTLANTGTGSIILVADGAATVNGAAGGSITAQANNGSVSLSTTGFSVTPSFDGQGGQITLMAGNTLTLTDSSSLSANGNGNGAGGSITISSGLIDYQNSAGTVLSLQANAGTQATGLAGLVNVSLNGTATTPTVNVILESTGSSSSGPGTATTAMSITALGAGLLNNGNPVNGVSVSAANNITVHDAASNFGIIVGTGVTNNTSGGIVQLNAGTGGTSGNISFADNAAPTFNGTGTGLAATNGVGTGNGGGIFLSALGTITDALSKTLSLSANGGTGVAGTASSGGTIVYNTGGTSAITVGTQTSTLEASATGGAAGSTNTTGGAGGSISIANGGPLTVNMAGASAAPLGKNGSGANYSFAAGEDIAGNLLVTGSINASAVGTGSGGSISLFSNSSTAFNAGSTSTKTTNGVIGSLTLAGGAGGTGGDLNIGNGNGGIILSTAISGFSRVNLFAAGAGTITQASAKALLTGGSIDAGTSSGNITLSVNAKNLQFNIDSGAGSVNVTDSSAVTLASSAVSGTGSFTLIDTSGISAAGTIFGGSAVVLTANSGNITYSGGIVATNPTNSTISLTAKTGDISGSGANNDIDASKSVTLSATKGSVSVDGIGNSIAPTTVSITALNGVTSNGNISAVTSTAKIAPTVTIKTTATPTGNGDIQLTGNILANNTTTPGLGTVTVTSTGSDVTALTNSATSDISAGKTVTLTASKGSISVGSLGQLARTSAISLSALNSIGADGNINADSSVAKAATSVTIKTTNTKAQGTISLAGNVEATNKVTQGLGTVTITATGTTAGTLESSADIGAGKTLTLTAAKGSISLDTLGEFTPTQTITVSALNSVGSTGNILADSDVAKAATAVTIKTTATTSGNGTIDLGGNIEALNSATSGLGTVTLTATGSGATAMTTQDVSAGKSAVVTAAKGSMSIGGAGQLLTTGTVSLTALNNLAVNGNIDANTNATVKTTGTASGNSLTVFGITTTSGPISVIGAGGNVNVGTASPAAVVSATSNSKTAKGTILIDDSNKTSGNITIGAVTNIATKGTDGGNVTIAIGTAPTKGVFGKAPSGSATYNGSTTPPPTGPFFFGTQSIQINSAVATTVLMNTVGTGQVIFSTGTLSASHIQIDQGTPGSPTTITADPPISSPSALLIQVPTQAAGAAPTLSLNSVPAIAQTVISAPPAVPTLSIQTANQTLTPVGSLEQSSAAGLTAVNSILQSTSSAASIANTLQTTSLAGQSSAAIASANQASSWNAREGASLEPAWISDTELANGMIPAILSSSEELTIAPTTSSVIEMKTGKEPSAKADVRTVSLKRGAVVFAPTTNTVVETPYGQIAISAQSVVLVMALQKGLAVYDIDDRHAGSVQIDTGTSKMALFPGSHCLITQAKVREFTDINPAQMIRYRNMRSKDLGNGTKAFISEFSVCDAMLNVMPLNELLRSTHPQARKIANRALKTGAIIMQLPGGKGQFEHYTRATLTAWTN